MYNINEGGKKLSKDNDFKIDIRINKYKLEEECEKHPSLYYRYSELLAQAKNERDDELDRLAVVLANVEVEIRKDPPIDCKLTENLIKALIEENKKVISQKSKVRECKKQVHILEAAVNAIEHRKSMLNNLVQLYIKGYYSKPGEIKNNNITDSISDDIRKDLNRRKNNG